MKADYVIFEITPFLNVMSCSWHKWDLWFSQWWVSRFCLNFWGVTKYKASHTRRCTHNIPFCKKLKCQNNVTPFNISKFRVFYPLMFNFSESKLVICVKFIQEFPEFNIQIPCSTKIPYEYIRVSLYMIFI